MNIFSIRALGLAGGLAAALGIGCSSGANGTSTSTTAATAGSSGTSTGSTSPTAASAAAASGTGTGSAGSTGAASASGGSSGSGTGTTGQTLCEQPTFQVFFSPMYSASIPGASNQVFQIPAIVGNGIDQSTLSWTASDLTKVSLEPDVINGGTLITTLAPGQVTIEAYVTSAPSVCGSSVLTITPNTLNDWELGSERYNLQDAGDQFAALRGDDYVACTNCHGPTATEGNLMTIAHTPEQTGGFSDVELANIITKGTIPDGGYFDDTIVSYKVWHEFHQWYMGDGGEDLPGIICYLRSLAPAQQTGTSNFGGHGPGDGGLTRPDGGFIRPDAGRRGGQPGGMCSPCNSNSDCGGGTCITDPQGNNVSFCAPLCSTDTDPDGGLACQAGTCFSLTNGFSGCYPDAQTCIGYDAGFGP